MGKKFRHLDVPSHWEPYFSKYPQGYTILEALIEWVSQVDEMVDNQNDLIDKVYQFRLEIDNFVNEFDGNLQTKVTDVLSDWQDSGFLDVVISEALQTQIDEVDNRLEQLSLNVKANGAIGDGIIDDTISIQSAIDTTHSNGGGVVFLPKGTYRITSPLMMKTGVSIVGVGSTNESEILNASSGNAISFPDTGSYTNVTLKDFSIKGDNVNFSPEYAIHGYNVRTSCLFENIRIWRHQKGIYLKDCWYAMFHRIYTNTVRTAMELRTANGCVVSECVIHAVSEPTVYAMIVHASKATIKNNYFETLNCERALSTTGFSISVIGNYFEKLNTTHGISNGAESAVIRENYFLRGEDWTCKRFISSGGDNANIDGNHIIDVNETSDYHIIVSGYNTTIGTNGVDEGKTSIPTSRYGVTRNRIVTSATTTTPSDPFIGEVVFNTNLKQPIWWNGEKWKESNTGTKTYNSGGFPTTTTITHGLSSTPSFFQVTPSSEDAGDAGIKYVTADATDLHVTFNSPPAEGTQNVSLTWKAEV